MKSLIFLTALSISLFSCKTAKHAGCDAYSHNMYVEDSSMVRSLNVFADSASKWTTEQKQEFAEVFFIERGKFTIPKEPIVLKSFKGN